MSKPQGQGSTLWVAIMIAAVVVVLIVLAAARVRLPKPLDTPPAVVTTSSVAIARTDNKGGNLALQKQVELYDPMPLFVPTTINSSDPALPASLRREPGKVFKAISPQLTFREYEMDVVFPAPIAIPKDAVEAMHAGETVNPFLAFGRINYPYTPLPKRLAFIEVVQAKTGRTVLAAPLNAEPTAPLPSVDWLPLELVVAIEPSGMVGAPTVISGSGFEEIDDFFRAFIGKLFRLGARLPPGFYILRIGQ